MSTENKTQVYLEVLGERLRKLRIKKGYTTIKELDIDGVNALGLGYIERGQRDIKYTTLIKLCEAFDVSIQDLFLNFDEEITFETRKRNNADLITNKNQD
jgi:transcriptional regulator with XRE-family HTH domain